MSRNSVRDASLVLLIAAVLIGTLLVDTAQAAETYRFTGRGTAHGVGLDMAGTKVLAEQGKDYRTILQTYYTGVSWGSRGDDQTIRYRRADGSEVTMTMRSYLARLAEEPDSWPTHGLRTLIVAARSYAWNKMDKLGYVPYWGQNFMEGIDPATRPHIVAAIDDTSGQILTYSGSPIVAAYHGNSGGRTENSEYVLGGTPSTYPYLRGVNSPWTPLHAWDFTLTRAEVEAVFNADPATYIGTLYGIDLSNRAPSGRVYKARLIGSAGVKDVWGYSQFAAKLGSKIGKSISSLIEIVPDNWEESLVITNPGSADAVVTMSFGGESATKQSNITVPAHRSRSVTADAYMGQGAVTVRLSSTTPVVAERSSRYTHRGYKGIHGGVGAPAASRYWYLPDGHIASNADTLIIMMNPQSTTVDATATYMRSSGRPVTKRYSIPAGGRTTVRLDDFIPTGWVSTRIRATGGLVVERSIYFDRDGSGGVGATALARQWFFADGNTVGSNLTRISVQNPNTTTAHVTLSFLREGGRRPLSRRFTIGALSRIQVRAEGYLHEGFGMKVRSDIPVAVDKAVYAQAGGKRSGSSVTAASALSKRWYLPGGSNSQTSTYILVANPSAAQVRVTVRSVGLDGRSFGGSYDIAPWRRIVVNAGAAARANTDFSTTVSATAPVVAEKAMYSAHGILGSLGAPAASTTWYFAEGYTGP